MSYHSVMQEAGRLYLLAVLRSTAGNVTHAARMAGMERKHLHKLIRRYGIDVDALIEGPRDRGLGRLRAHAQGLMARRPQPEHCTST